ncbi:VOC family protein [Massilia sp. DWR3-1-1]|uniref:VOC family protein n=1 Tax=Massilia sp. DWR3-1-1 TaxID=2804559 RepID=UPI003CF822F9
MITGLRTVIYPVSDLAAASAWYQAVLERAPYFDAVFYVGFEVGGFELGLVPDGQPGPDGATAYWSSSDIEADIDRIVALGASVHTPLDDVGGGIRVASLRDPDGNQFALIDNPHFDPAKVR